MVLAVPWPLAEHPQKGSGSVFALSLRQLKAAIRWFPALMELRWCPQLFLVCHVLQLLSSHGPPLDLPQYSSVFSLELRFSLVRAKLMITVTFLNSQLLLMQTSAYLVFITARADCCLTFNLPTTWTPEVLLLGCFQSVGI